MSCYYCTVDENINSFDKIRDVEQFALQTARYLRSQEALRACSESTQGDETPRSDLAMEVIPFLRNATATVDVEAFLRAVEADVGAPNDPILREKLRQALLERKQLHSAEGMAAFREKSDPKAIATHREKLGYTIDVVMDALARWWGHTVEGNDTA
ncbi:unnamed protein product [Phytomonas sp. Hart1]|nr:unnamed protein product [Phytomonas sp. Hart1]|eukprot:CCW71438.1 unnamed protein product [Phytomonas sp. isolate Hart1]